MNENPIIEACVCSVSEAIAAENAGADRIELCSRLDLNGLTPEIRLVNAVMNAVDIPIKVMLRPRDGFHSYNKREEAIIKDQIIALKRCGARHFVYGVLKNQHLDLDNIGLIFNTLCTISPPLCSFTIHKAIDATANIVDQLRALKDHYIVKQAQKSGIQIAILSSGGANTAAEGSTILKEMVKVAEKNIEIIVGGKVVVSNFAHLHKEIGAPAYHGRKILAI